LFEVSKEPAPSHQILCDAPDTGSFVLPASIVNRAFELGVTPFADVEITRVSVADPPNPPGMTFEMRSWFERLLDMGLVYCRQDSDCAAGSVCTPERICE
jgi:Cys-rich repeat protein